MAATEGKLGALHDKMATVMGKALEQYETQQEVYDKAVELATENEDMESMPIAAPELNSSLLSVIERFLNNNKITCVPEEGNSMGELAQKLEAKRKRRATRQVGNVVHLDDAD